MIQKILHLLSALAVLTSSPASCLGDKENYGGGGLLSSTLNILFGSLTKERDPIISVTQGDVRGSTKVMSDGSTYYSFVGIPYAKPPLGTLRFKAPLPPDKWDGVYDATTYSSVCIQDLVMKIGSENCLTLNIYTESLKPDSKLPVMVFIHGGGNKYGSGKPTIYGPEYFLQHDVIVVTFNYRLEVLGLLNLDIPEVPGNAALKDQVAALRYIKNNIAAFGGDPDNITIFGQSSGAASVAYHIVSPMSRGLFNKAIAQSGNCIMELAIKRFGSKENAFEVGKYLGKETNDTKELLEFLQSVPALKFAGLSSKIEKNFLRPALPFLPIIEKNLSNAENFLTEDPLNILALNKTNKVPLMTGYASSEALFLIPFLPKFKLLNKNFTYMVPKEIANNISQRKLKKFGESIKKFYFGDEKISKTNLNKAVQLICNVIYYFNTIRFMDLYTRSNQNIYAYRFNYDTDLNVVKFITGTKNFKGASHADDLFYMFNNLGNEFSYGTQKILRKIVFTYTKLWTNFAKTGNPTPDNSLDFVWDPYTTTSRKFLHLEDPPAMGEFVEHDQYEFLYQIYLEAGIPHLK